MLPTTQKALIYNAGPSIALTKSRKLEVSNVPGGSGDGWYPGPLVWFWSDIQSGVREIT